MNSILLSVLLLHLLIAFLYIRLLRKQRRHLQSTISNLKSEASDAVPAYARAAPPPTTPYPEPAEPAPLPSADPGDDIAELLAKICADLQQPFGFNRQSARVKGLIARSREALDRYHRRLR